MKTDTSEDTNQEKTVKKTEKTKKNTKKSAKSEVAQLKTENTELKDKYLRLYSEFENFRRRTAKEKLDLIQSAGSELIADLLPVLDDFERARKSLETTEDANAVKEGIELVYGKFKNILEQKGLKPMESIGNESDPDLHETIAQTPAPKEELKGKIIDEIECGYYLHDKVIRFAKVVIGS